VLLQLECHFRALLIIIVKIMCIQEETGTTKLTAPKLTHFTMTARVPSTMQQACISIPLPLIVSPIQQ
jgi:hypothetical protein